MSITTGLVAAAIGAGLAASALTITASADTPAPPPPTRWMQTACPTDAHGIPAPSATDCYWTGTTSNGPVTVYLTRTRIVGTHGYRPHLEARCMFYVQPRLDRIASGCTLRHKAHPTG